MSQPPPQFRRSGKVTRSTYPLQREGHRDRLDLFPEHPNVIVTQNDESHFHTIRQLKTAYRRLCDATMPCCFRCCPTTRHRRSNDTISGLVLTVYVPTDIHPFGLGRWKLQLPWFYVERADPVCVTPFKSCSAQQASQEASPVMSHHGVLLGTLALLIIDWLGKATRAADPGSAVVPNHSCDCRLAAPKALLRCTFVAPRTAWGQHTPHGDLALEKKYILCNSWAALHVREDAHCEVLASEKALRSSPHRQARRSVTSYARMEPASTAAPLGGIGALAEAPPSQLGPATNTRIWKPKIHF